jgi:hypothetical protein
MILFEVLSKHGIDTDTPIYSADVWKKKRKENSEDIVTPIKQPYHTLMMAFKKLDLLHMNVYLIPAGQINHFIYFSQRVFSGILYLVVVLIYDIG